MLGTDNFIYDDRLSELSELDETFGQGDKVSCSTPIKLKYRRSYSLIDISNVDNDLHMKQKLAVSTDTIGSGSQNSLCKDSGYVHSESNTSLNSNKDNKRLSELIQDLKFKEVLISELQESNHTLRLKYAEAENRIAELRLKCEAHCDCCNYNSSSNPPSTPINEYGFVSAHRKASDHCLVDRNLHSPCLDLKSKHPSDTSIPASNDDSFLKVRLWQDTLSALKPVASDISTYTHTKQSKSVDGKSQLPAVQTRIIGERSVRVSPVSKSVMQFPTRTTDILNLDTSSVKNERTTSSGSTKDVCVVMENLQNLIIGETEVPVFVGNGNLERCPSSLCSSDFINNQVLVKSNDRKLFTNNNRSEGVTTVGNTARASVSFHHEYNGKINRVRYIDRKLEMERTIREGMNGIAERGKKESGMRFKPWESNTNNFIHDKNNSNSLYDCIIQANEIANRLSIGLSRIPTALDSIKSITNKI